MEFESLKLVARQPVVLFQQDDEEERLQHSIFEICKASDNGVVISEIRQQLVGKDEFAARLPTLGLTILRMVRNNHLSYVEGDSSGRFKWQDRLAEQLRYIPPGYVSVHVPMRCGASTMATRLANERGWAVLTDADLNVRTMLEDTIDACINGQYGGIVLDCGGRACTCLEEFGLRIKARVHGFYIVDIFGVPESAVSVWMDLGCETESA